MLVGALKGMNVWVLKLPHPFQNDRMMAEKIIGIIGGVGPEATLDLYKKIIKATPAKTDQEHLRVIIDSNCKIPDRVKAIFADGEDPAPVLIETAKNLERAGADLILIACNAAHYYYDAVVNHVSIPVLHIVEETVSYCSSKFPRFKTFGLLAGSSTVKLGLYPRGFERIEAKILNPRPEDQGKVMGCIYKIKAGDLGAPVREELLGVARRLAHQGAEAIILGCTEVPLVLEDGDLPFPFIDPTRVLAEAGVTRARG
ncbi:MAG: amino acid racemase [Pseudomonadota bacterium]